MKTFFYSSLLLLSSCALWGQDSLRGKILDAHSREPLPGAVIHIPGTSNACITDEQGCFCLPLSSGEDSVLVSYIGYHPKKLKAQGCYCLVTLNSNCSAMDEVIVSASRNTQPRSEAPVAISKISSAAIADARPVQLSELLNKAPGVMMLNLNNEQHGMSIRQPMGTSPYYLYMEDGLPIRAMGVFNHNALIEMNLFAIQSIEVTKGPASGLYGPEAVGGAVNFITIEPGTVFSSKAGVQADNYGYRRINYNVSGPAGKRLSYFTAGSFSSQQNGWMKYSDFSKNALNVRLNYRLSGKTRLSASGAYVDYFSQTPGSVDSAAFYSRQYISQAQFTYREIRSLRLRASAEHQWTKRQNTLLHLFHRNNTINQNPAYAIRWQSGKTSARGEVNSNTFMSKGFLLQHNMNSRSGKIRGIAGLSADDSPVKYSAHQVDLRAKLRADGRSVESYEISEERFDIRLSDYRARILNTAAFTQVEYKPVQDLNIVFGARYDRMSFSYHNHLDGKAGHKSFDRVTPRMGASYRISRNAGLYANFSQGFAPPGLTTIFTPKPGSSDFYYELQAATFNNMEAGYWLGLLKKMVSLEMTVYQMQGKNELLNLRQADNSTAYQSAGKTLHRGVEFSVLAKPMAGLTVRSGGSYALHRYEEFILSERQNDALKNINGKIMPGAPSWMANSEIMYKPIRLRGLKIALEWQYLSSWYMDQVNTTRYSDKGAFGMRGLSILHFRTSYVYRNLELSCNIMNLANELYANNASRSNTPGSSAVYTPGAPRTLVIGLIYSFTAKEK